MKEIFTFLLFPIWLDVERQPLDFILSVTSFFLTLARWLDLNYRWVGFAGEIDLMSKRYKSKHK